MNEFEFIDSITQGYYRQSSVIKGIGDDAAVLRHPYHDLVTAVDTMVDGIHFSKETVPAFYIGYRTLAANISDIAAMGAVPTSYMISLVVPKDYSDNELQAIYQGMDQLSRKYHMDLIGGDTVTGDQLVVSVTIHGLVEKDKARLRSHARDGDIVFVTGTLGDSRFGLGLLLDEYKDQSYRDRLDKIDRDYFINRHQQPTPRVDFAEALKSLRRVALNDVSDGIASEAHEIAKSSQMTLFIDDDQVPVHQDMYSLPDELIHDYKYSGGEDFELLGTVSEQDFPFVVEAARRHHLPLRQIGYVKDSEQTNGQVYLKKQGTLKRLKKTGYTHKN
ncbi:thiamine-monophosphate kinase [Halolactibacillus miurensis]|uniref:Thiamine-monophosphate kinase n=1 Tax=Halolactibacillus miurensis TaxID=306541 RepID=A0A1I6TW16_9BACI|nr:MULTISPECIES: thiamine-phosphate kinase [Halolactibacillus]GEM05433.1 thiamine-monophosphate kinase [Halolactibacillus miurensis]SFS93361.1 thiamine-monophosphate kinase [Halolactibacillus miurensis]